MTVMSGSFFCEVFSPDHVIITAMIEIANRKNRLRGSKPSALHGKPLCYGTVGLLNQNIYLRSKINVTLAKGNTIVALRRKPGAMTL